MLFFLHLKRVLFEYCDYNRGCSGDEDANRGGESRLLRGNMPGGKEELVSPASSSSF